MIENSLSDMASALLLCVVYFLVTLAFNGRKTFSMSASEYYLMPIFILAATIGARAVRIESKIDALNTCGPAEVVVSGEGE